MDEGRRVETPSKSTTMVKPTFKKVQVVYYVTKNGQLEHPHIVEVTHLVHHQLRLKDVLDRLSVLRGRGMPFLYSWSCKKMYKNGYVWNDLGEKDVICPSEGDEYVLKASQLVLHSDKHMQDGEAQMCVAKLKPITPKRQTEYNEEELDFEEKRINYANNTPSKCSRGIRGISTTLTPPSPPPSLSTISSESISTSKRFEDGDPYPTLSRNSVLLQLMACGGSIGLKGKPDDDHHHHSPNMSARKSSSSSNSLNKGVFNKAVVVVEDEICCMSENPRFGNLQAEEREYFSGSIVETITEERVEVESMLNKSSSYKERRSKATITLAEKEEEEMKREKSVSGKCIPKGFCLKSTKI